MKINLYDIKQISGCLGEEVPEGWERWIAKGDKETAGDRYIHQLKCADILMSKHMSKLIKLWSLNLCRFSNVNFTSVKLYIF